MGENNGFLTSTDKEFLRSDGEYYTNDTAKQSRYERRQAIAERTRQAFHDFSLLAQKLNEHERNRIFDVGPIDDPSVIEIMEKGGIDEMLDGNTDRAGEITEEEIRRRREEEDRKAEFREALIDTIGFLYHCLEGEADSSAIRERGFRVPFGVILHGGVVGAEKKRRGAMVPNTHVKVTFEVDVHQGGTVEYDYIVDKFAKYEQNELTEGEIRALLNKLTTEGAPKDLRDFAEEIDAQREQLDYDLSGTSDDTTDE